MIQRMIQGMIQRAERKKVTKTYKGKIERAKAIERERERKRAKREELNCLLKNRVRE